ncbi:MAG: metal-dependent hydrolase [Nanoarchaeota archaeon]
MLNKTHLAIGLFFMLFFLSRVVHVWTYVIVFLIATLLPNLDRFVSFRGIKIMGTVRVRKRGFFHSFTFCFIITFLLVWFFPIVAFPFFLGYGVHLLVDSWTIEGIKPFWPLRYTSKGSVKTGGGFEHILFYSFVVADLVMVWFLF